MAAVVITAIITGELGVILTYMTIDYATPKTDGTLGRRIRGRQLMPKIVEYYKQDERKTAMYSIQEIMRLTSGKDKSFTGLEKCIEKLKTQAGPTNRSGIATRH